MRYVIVLLLAIGLCAPAGAGRVLREWRFDMSAALEQWTINQDVADARVADGVLRFRGSGTDPILATRERFEITATPWQAVEIRLRADRDGGMELFWSGTAEGRYGGFSGEKATPFTVRGDGAWRTIRVYPFWQHEGRIIQLRLDPYSGAAFDIAWVRIVEAEPSGGWRIAHGVRVANGLVTLLASNGFSMRPAGADATQTPIVAVRAGGVSGNRASIVFATDASPGLHQLSFPVEQGAGERTYNVDMLNSPDWRGRIVAIGIRPGESAGDRMTVRDLRISGRALGPARLRVLSFSVDEALPRAGAAFGITARVSNTGGAAARVVVPTISAPQGVRITGMERGQSRSVLYGQEEEWRWTARCARPMTTRLALRVSSANTPGAAAATVLSVTPRVVLPRGRVPEPKPVRGKIDAGVYYFPGWRSASSWSPIMRYPERRPVLGWYREGDPAIAAWHVRWAVEHGITFFAYDWYWNQGSRSLEHALHEGLFQARNGKLLQFCLLWANHNPDGSSSRQDCLNVTRYWIQNYFRRPEYYCIAGRPVVIIFSTYRLRSDMGSDAVREAFDAMRQACRDAGVPPVYLIACVGGDTGEAQLAAREGYDAISAYNWPGLGVPAGQTRASFADLIPAYRRHWQSLADVSPIPMMLPVCGGWDSRPWHGETALVRYGRTPALFQRHLADARAFIQEYPAKVLPVALIEAWNELGEGSYIEPHREFGFGYLDAIRDVFTDAPRRHTDLTPADIGVPAPQVEPMQPGRSRWTFGRGTQGWSSMMNLTDARSVGGVLRADTTGSDPAFNGPPLQTDASRWRSVRIRMRLTALDGGRAESTAQLFWATRTTGTSEAASEHAAVRADGVWRDLVFRVGSNPRWRGIVTSLRFDPCSLARVRVEIGSIALVR